MLKSEGTRLSTIHSHVLQLTCACGHTASVRVSALLALKSPPATVGDAIAKARCRGCGQIDVQSCEIIYKTPHESATNRQH